MWRENNAKVHEEGPLKILFVNSNTLEPAPLVGSTYTP